MQDSAFYENKQKADASWFLVSTATGSQKAADRHEENASNLP